jgi:hypothetical protein
MVENVDLTAMVKKLSAEFDALIGEREEVRTTSETLRARAEEIERKLKGIQTTLQGLMLYTTAQEVPTELMRKTTMSMAEAMKKMRSVGEIMEEMQVAGPDVKKTMTECCRDILRQKNDWMSPVEIRDALLAAGYDFSNYTSPPLPSIHTALKRMVPDELLTETRADGQVYRWKNLTQRVRETAAPPSLVPMNTPGTSVKRAGNVTGPTSAYDSGMRADEKPKK